MEQLAVYTSRISKKMISISIPKVLFIKGVFKKDCIKDDFLEQKIIETINNDAYIGDVINNVVAEVGECTSVFASARPSYRKLPSLFESIDDWPEKTNLLCWHCSLPFDTTPIFIPKVIEPVISKTKKSKYSIGVFGVFCSFGDAVEFIKNTNWSLIDKIEALNKVKHLYKIFYGTHLKEIVSYPSIYDMVQYGGDMEPSQYRELTNKFKSNAECCFNRSFKN